MDILPTITMFSHLDLKNPNQKPKQPFFYISNFIQDTGTTFELGNGIAINKKTSSLRLTNQEVPIKTFFQIISHNDGKTQIDQQPLASEGLNLIFLANEKRFILLDDFYLNSSYIQMFVFERYDPTLFEPVLINPMSKIYRLKV